MLASRAARQGLQPYVQDVARAFTTSRPAGAVPAVADPVAPQGFLAKLFGSGGSRPDTPLTDPLPAYQHAPAVAPPSSKPQLESNTLPNGAKIASEATFVSTSSALFGSKACRSTSLFRSPIRAKVVFGRGLPPQWAYLWGLAACTSSQERAVSPEG